jgi:GNAT superfamily N-acetyltransferase
MTHHFRKGTPADSPTIWAILQQAVLRRKLDGSRQWQDGYPNEDVVRHDIEKSVGYVLTVDEVVAGYAAILINDEPAYNELKGNWITNGDFVVLHRLAVSDQFLGQGIAQKMLHHTELLALENNIHSVKIDTNFDNVPMLKIVEKLGYQYCGEVTFRGGVRMAFEKLLSR